MSKKALSLRQIIILLAFAAVVIAGIIYWAVSNFRWEEKEIDHGYSRKAQQNDFLAAEIFLRNHGVQATSVKNLSLLDNHRWRNIPLGQDDTIVLINANKTLNQERYDRLYEWIENGGTLITSTQNPFMGSHTREEDLLLRDFGITPAADHVPDLAQSLFDAFDNKDDEDEEQEESTEDSTEATDSQHAESLPKQEDKKSTAKKTKKEDKPENYYRCNLMDEPTEIAFADEEKPLRFDFSRYDPFFYQGEDNYESESIVENEIPTEDAANTTEGSTVEERTEDNNENTDNTETSHMLYFDVGAGGITITSDNTIWSNRRIDCHDHAYALWSLANHNGRVWFLINQDAPSLAAIVWRNAPYGVLAALLALLLWLWAKSQRFGPVFASETLARRSLAEHIFASAMLLWRNQQHPQLLALLRQHISTRLLQQHPHLLHASQQERSVFLQELTGIELAAIQRALYAEDVHQPQDFANAIAHLQTIRKQL
ncbi:hypothetical protein CBP51_06105 [Cellvibrio mixtus]|uniref:DUF4350 domain-containing protein n=1 Tax=Cellvibrio mixtus TaxID=39650 RepID=A0A266QB39_9GAMM|nr:DUF4350 domain-containing protein [Cellvibrio mixtus]OZY86591.1 hypothetical protein CBP51_06105 [Cellvibrio mixtus]